jgi:hypothetical protein
MPTKKIQIIGNNLSATYETKQDAQGKLDEAKAYTDSGNATTLKTSQTYTDTALAQKSQVQIITWEDGD